MKHLEAPIDRDLYVQQLQDIHALRDKLKLSSTDYRDLLFRLTGSRSAKFMTTEQRQRVATFMRIHTALDEAIELTEQARDSLNESPQELPNCMEKVISLDGKREATMTASLEDVIQTVRELYGDEVRLTEIQERRIEDKTVLELSFERPGVFILAL